MSSTGSTEFIAALRGELTRVGYSLQSPEIRISKIIEDYTPHREWNIADEDERIEAHMDAGDSLRKQYQDKGILARLAVAAIHGRRNTDSACSAWVVDSLKDAEEVEVLRSVYGQRLIVISIYADQDLREKQLARKIAKTRGPTAQPSPAKRAEELTRRDQHGGEDAEFGQNVRRTFPLGDYFVSASQDPRSQVSRLVETLFGRPTRSPTRDEYGMAMAKATALRSADLSRQVGAVIVDDDGEVLVAGCNEVPKPGSGVYWEGDAQDSRDFQIGYDPNAQTSHELLMELFERLKSEGWLSKKMANEDPAALAQLAREKGVLGRTRVESLVEFGRIVHAEMNALLRGTSTGVSLRGMKMICTTFPCHVCARHLIGAGIREVVYIEPYPKSLAPNQYPEALSIGERPPPGAVHFRPFLGWSPGRYWSIFAFKSRKDDNDALRAWDPTQTAPKIPNLHFPAGNLEEETARKTLDLVESPPLSSARQTATADKARKRGSARAKSK